MEIRQRYWKTPTSDVSLPATRLVGSNKEIRKLPWTQEHELPSSGPTVPHDLAATRLVKMASYFLHNGR